MPANHAGRWHATNHYAPRSLGDDGEVTLELAIAPPLEAGTPRIDLVAAGQSAEGRARLPLSWTWNHDSDRSRLPHLGRAP